ncbi:MAG: DnaD domain protein [Lachnospiraceae bacterium]|nr:DnaD domain protein [Lachnospiraceae bacterium]
MTNITITNESLHDVTIVSNIFIDYYMSDANGEYVKTYLYLLRAVTTGEALSVTSIADKLNYTERDVCRALLFWEKQGILALSFGNNNSLETIRLLPIRKPENAAAMITIPETMAKTSYNNVKTPSLPEKDISHFQTAMAYKEPEKHEFTLDEMDAFKKNPDITEILFIAEQYLGKTLSHTDINTILYIYDSLKFSTELIEYLIEYCVSHNHKSMRYIEKTALAWAADNIHTIEQAKNSSDTYNQNCFAVMKAFGIKNRHPAEIEQKFITAWTSDYGFTLDIITEACNRTIQATHSPSFEYADTILKRWQEKGVKHLSDIHTLDTEFQKNKERRNASSTPSNTNNRFLNFEQNSYDFDELERELLNH